MSEAAHRRTVIVVEERGQGGLGLRESLSKLGYFVPECVSTGPEALQLMAAHPPAVVMMELQLKGEMDGVKTARRMREQGEFALIYVTNSLSQSTWHRTRDNLPDAWLLRPFTLQQLDAAVRRALAA